METWGWNITSLLYKKQRDPFTLLWTLTHSLNGRHMLTFTSARYPLSRHRGVFSSCIWCHLTFTREPSNPAPPHLEPHWLLSAVAAERDSLEVSEVFRNMQLQTESGRRNKKWHFDLSGCEASPARLPPNVSLCLPLPPPLETQRNMYLN